MYDGAFFGLSVSFGRGETGPQCAFIVSKKVSPKSIVRHDVKRKLADGITPFLPRVKKNVQLVFLVKQKAAGANKSELLTEVEGVLHRAKLL